MATAIKLIDIANHVRFTEENTKKLLDIFYASAKTLIDNMVEADHVSDYDQLYRNAHSLKGSSANLLFQEVADIARAIESAALNKEKYPYKKDIEHIQELLRDTKII